MTKSTADQEEELCPVCGKPQYAMPHDRTGAALVARIRELEQEARVNGLQQGVYSFANYLCHELQEIPPSRQAIQNAADDYFIAQSK